jgi:hypothetical protein
MAAVSESTKPAENASSGGAPVVVDMGKHSRKTIKKLRSGRGKLLAEVNGVVAELRSAGSISESAQPIVIVVREKLKAPSIFWPLA